MMKNCVFRIRQLTSVEMIPVMLAIFKASESGASCTQAFPPSGLIRALPLATSLSQSCSTACLIWCLLTLTTYVCARAQAHALCCLIKLIALIQFHTQKNPVVICLTEVHLTRSQCHYQSLEANVDTMYVIPSNWNSVKKSCPSHLFSDLHQYQVFILKVLLPYYRFIVR